MSEDDRQIRLLLLHEAGGEIEGRGKYHKLLDRYRREAEDAEVEHVVKERGPYDPGLSRSVQRYLDLELVETDEEGASRDVRETQKGERYMSGYEKVRTRLDDSFRNTVRQARQVLGEYGDKSMSQMVQEEDVQEDKELPYGTRLSAENTTTDEDS